MKADLYSVLEVWSTASIEEIKKSYFRLAKLHHPDVAGDTPENRERFKLINEAYSILSDPQERHQYDELLKRKKKTSKSSIELQEKDRRSADLSFMQAKEAMRNGRYDKAALLYKAAIKYDPGNPAYHSWYGFCLGLLNVKLHEARDACKKAVEMEFYNSEYHANLGFVYFKAGLKSLAVKHFNEALKWDSENKVANKFMLKLNRGKNRELGPLDKIGIALKKVFVKVT